MPYFDPNDSLTGSESPSTTPLPRRPRPAVTASSSYDDASPSPRRDSRRRESHGRQRSYREEPRVKRPDPPRRESTRRPKDTDREERRRSRGIRDPDREARRARREERAAHDPEYAARREQRREAKRAERRASRHIEQRDNQHRDINNATRERDAEDLAARTDDDELARSPEPQTPLQDPTHDTPALDALKTDGYDQQGLDSRDLHPPSEYDDNQYSQRRSPRRHSQRLTRGESFQSSGDDWTVDLENSSVDEKRDYRSNSSSAYSEVDYYRRYSRPDERDHYRRRRERQCCCGFGRKCCIISSSLIALIVLIIIIVVAVVVSRNKFSYSPSTAQVNETAAFTSGAATRNSVNDTKDGIGAGVDQYVYYKGNATDMLTQVPSAKWVSFEDMWNNNLATIQQSCGWLDYGDNDSTEEVQDIYNAIQDRANASLVDHRLILAFILQESKGCVRVPNTESSGGVKNTGLMQAHHGHEYDAKHMANSIMWMVQDGTQGTSNGNGIVQELNAYYGNPYSAARAYNSGYIPTSGDLSEAAGATACYVSDIVNRLTGWVSAKSTCPGS